MSLLKIRTSKKNSIDLGDQAGWLYTRMIGSKSKFGEVWMVDTHENNIAIKKIPMTKYDIKIGLRKSTPNEFLTMKRSIWVELFFLKKCESLVKKNICPGFILIFFDEIQKETIFYSPKLIPMNGSSCMMIGMELAKTDLNCFSSIQKKTTEWIGIVFQILFSILTYQKHLKICHNDLHWGNILIHQVVAQENSSPPQYLLYQYKDTKFYVPFFGYLCLVIDFGFVTKLNRENIMKDVRRISHLNKWVVQFHKISERFLDEFHYKSNMTESVWDLLKNLKKHLPSEVSEDSVYDVFLIDKSI